MCVELFSQVETTGVVTSGSDEPGTLLSVPACEISFVFCVFLTVETEYGRWQLAVCTGKEEDLRLFM